MQVFDFNRFSKHNIIGELRLQLCDVDWNHVIEEWQDLAGPAKFEVFLCPSKDARCARLTTYHMEMFCDICRNDFCLDCLCVAGRKPG